MSNDIPISNIIVTTSNTQYSILFRDIAIPRGIESWLNARRPSQHVLFEITGRWKLVRSLWEILRWGNPCKICLPLLCVVRDGDGVDVGGGIWTDGGTGIVELANLLDLFEPTAYLPYVQRNPRQISLTSSSPSSHGRSGYVYVEQVWSSWYWIYVATGGGLRTLELDIECLLVRERLREKALQVPGTVLCTKSHLTPRPLQHIRSIPATWISRHGDSSCHRRTV
jgi:hypothetical protein